MKIAISIAVVILLSCAGWFFFSSDAQELDPKVQEVKDKMDELAEQFRNEKKDVTPEQLQKTAQEVHEKMESLSEDERHELRSAGREMFRERIQKSVDEYFAAPEEERVAILDKHIDQMERFRKMVSSMRPPRTEGEGGGSGGGPGGRPGFGGGGPGGGRPGGGSGVMDPERMNQRRASMLSHTTPEQRAYFSALMERREERGMPSFFRGR